MDWMSNPDTIKWLLEKENPSVRYFTLKDLLDKGEEDPEVKEAKAEIMGSGLVPQILGRQQEAPYIDSFPRFYTDKYKGLVWQLIVLAELGAGPNPQISAQCQYLLENSQETEDGGFAMHTAAKIGGGRISEVIPCLTGNMVWSLIRFGYLDDPRVQKAIDWMIRFMPINDGVEENRQTPPYDKYEMCWGKHTCFMGAVKVLKALSAIPKEQRTKEASDTIDKIVEFLLIHHIYKRSHDLNKKSKPGWLKLSFPLMYQTDVLEILDILTELGVKDTRMDDALNLVLSKRDDMGRWRMENPSITDKMLMPMEGKGQQSKWITLRAMRVLKRYNAVS